jgi:hypothetical protein
MTLKVQQPHQLGLVNPLRSFAAHLTATSGRGNMRLETRTVQKGKFKTVLHPLVAILVFFLIVSCASGPGVVGRWREIGKSATLEFWRDGTFKAVDNQGMAVRGKYTLDEKGNMRVEITLQGSPPEVVKGKVTVQGDELTFEYSNHNDVERYKREK